MLIVKRFAECNCELCVLISKVWSIKMGMFSWFSTTLKKSSAAVIIQDALDAFAKSGLLESQPAALANRMVEAAYTRLPNLADRNYNKYVLAVSVLTMVPALPSFSVNERDSSTHALGILLKHVLELQLSNTLALTISEQNILERAQQSFLERMPPPSEFRMNAVRAAMYLMYMEEGTSVEDANNACKGTGHEDIEKHKESIIRHASEPFEGSQPKMIAAARLQGFEG